MTEALVGALGGGLVGGVVSWLVAVWQFNRQRSDRLADAQLDLVRRISRYKSGGQELAAALNEVPVVFANDPKALQLYERATPKTDRGAEMDLVIALLTYLASAVRLPVSREHLSKGFSA